GTMAAVYSATASLNRPLGSVSRNSTVRSPVATTSSSMVKFAAAVFGSSGSLMRSKVKMTSSGVMGLPSENLMPFFRVQVQTVESSLASKDSASSGTTCESSSQP